jgi:hypothetical protein
MKQFVNGQAAKAVAGLIGAATIFLSHYADTWWEPSAVAALTALAVWVVPNAPKGPPAL